MSFMNLSTNDRGGKNQRNQNQCAGTIGLPHEKKKKKKRNLNSSYTRYIKINPNVKCKIIKLLGETQGEIFVTLC